MLLKKMSSDIGTYSLTMNARIILWYQFDVVVKVLKFPLKFISVKSVIASQLSSLQRIGYTICIETPKRTLKFCFKFQKTILLFPFRCSKMAFDLATCVLKQTRIQTTKKEPNVAEVITGVKNPTIHAIHNAAQNLQISAVNFVQEQNKNSSFKKYKEEIEKWSAETDKKIDCMTLNAEDKQVIRSLAINMNNLKILKATRSKLNASFCEALTNIVSNDSYSTIEVKTMKNNFKNVNAVSSEIKETKEHCLAVINTSNKLNNLFSKILLQNESVSSTAPPFDMSHKMHTLVSKVRSDNDSLKITLAGTNKKLGEILNVTENISKTVQELYGQFMEVPKLHNELCAMKSKLEEQQKLLKRVEGERNDMKVRLDVLDTLILEEQTFLDSLGKTNPVPNEKLRSSKGLKVMENCNGSLPKI